MSTESPNQNSPEDGATVFVVDDDESVRASLVALIESIGLRVACFSSANEFLENARRDVVGCLLLDVRMPGMNGVELHERLVAEKSPLPVIIITAHGSVPMSVRAVQQGAIDFLEKPYPSDKLIESIQRAIQISVKRREELAERARAEAKLSKLSQGEVDVLRGVVAGKLNKVIASELDISLRTVEYRKASLMNKLDVDSNAALVSLVRWMESIASDAPMPRVSK